MSHERTQFLREAGLVERMHTEPHFGSYSVGLHSYNAVNLLLLLNPSPSMNLVKAVLWHDAAERLTGDVPAPAKWANPELKASLDLSEDRILGHYGLKIVLDSYENQWLKAVDRLELWIWASEQARFGFQFSGEACSMIEKLMQREDSFTPYEVTKFMAEFIPGTRISSNHDVIF